MIRGKDWWTFFFYGFRRKFGRYNILCIGGGIWKRDPIISRWIIVGVVIKSRVKIKVFGIVIFIVL